MYNSDATDFEFFLSPPELKQFFPACDFAGNLKMPISAHSHSGQFCKHAFSTLEEVVLRAIEVGFTHYGLSEHMPRYNPGDLYDEEKAVRRVFLPNTLN